MGDAVDQAGFNCCFLRIGKIGSVVEVPKWVDIPPLDSAFPGDSASRGRSGIRKRLSHQSRRRNLCGRQCLEDFRRGCSLAPGARYQGIYNPSGLQPPAHYQAETQMPCGRSLVERWEYRSSPRVPDRRSPAACTQSRNRERPTRDLGPHNTNIRIRPRSNAARHFPGPVLNRRCCSERHRRRTRHAE